MRVVLAILDRLALGPPRARVPGMPRAACAHAQRATAGTP